MAIAGDLRVLGSLDALAAPPCPLRPPRASYETVRRVGAEVVVVEAGAKLEDIVMFRRSSLLRVTNVTLASSPMMLIMMSASPMMALAAVAYGLGLGLPARSTSTPTLQALIDYACGFDVTDCLPIQQNGLCYLLDMM